MPETAGDLVKPPQTRKVVGSRNLAVLQLVIGLLVLLLGAATFPLLISQPLAIRIRPGVWAGGWISITGIIGIISTNNKCLNWVYLIFNIVSFCASSAGGLFVGISTISYAYNCGDSYYCEEKTLGLGLHIPVLILLVVEFFVCIVASVYCCQRSKCFEEEKDGLEKVIIGEIGEKDEQHKVVVTRYNSTTEVQQKVVQLSDGYFQHQHLPLQAPAYVYQMIPQVGTQMLQYILHPPYYDGAPIVNARGNLTPAASYDQLSYPTDKPVAV